MEIVLLDKPVLKAGPFSQWTCFQSGKRDITVDWEQVWNPIGEKEVGS